MGWKHLVTTAVAAFATVALTITPAHADTNAIPNGLGSTNTAAGMPSGALGMSPSTTGGAMANSQYNLTMVDPLTQTMTMGVVGANLTGDYAVVNDLAGADMLAIDVAELSRTARLAEDARRAALNNRGGGGGLKPGSVPAEYEGLILSAIANYCPQLSPSILAAQIEAESNWNPRAQSSAGAQGIAQFMPGTWSSYGVDGNNDGRKDVFNPADAIPAAARYDCALRDIVRKVPGDLDTNMLAAYNAGPGRVLQHQGVPPFTETRNYVTKILNRAAEIVDDSEDGNPGSAGTASGCPTTAPTGTLRDAAAGMSINKICADSVRQARTPQAARAIKYTLRNLGVPYSQASRMSANAYDCSSYVMRAYQAGGSNVISGGWAPNTYSIEGQPWAKRIAFTDRKPGDLVYPFPGHIAMSLAHGLKVHTNRPGDVSHVNNMYSSAYLTVRITI